ncbi:MAG: oligosaccharide flippase family protein [Oscillospiraceae bacterium]|jgi:stage V sporulation protein B
MLYSTLVLTVTGIVSQLMGFLYRVALSRLIGAENMGLYQLLMPVYACALSIVSVGLSVSVSRLSAEHKALRNTRAIAQVVRQCLVFLLVLFTIVAGATVLFYDPISVYLLGDARTQMGLLLLLPCVLLTAIENIHKHYFYGTGQVRPPAFAEISEQIIRISAVLALLLFFLPQNNETTVGLIVLGMGICEVVSAVTLVSLYRYNLKRAGRTGTPLPPKQIRRSIRSIAVPVSATSLLENFMSSINAIIIPQRLVVAGWSVSSAMSAFGILFGMALPMLMLPSAFIGALCTVLVPKLAQSAALGRRGEINQRMGKALASTSLIVLPFLALMLTIGPVLGEALFLEPSVGDYLPILSVGVLFSCYESVLGSALNGLSSQQAAAGYSLLCSFVQLVITYACTAIPGVGLYGFLIGFVVSSVLGVVLCGICLIKETGLRIRLGSWFFLPALAAAFAGLCAHLLFGVLTRAGLSPLPSALFVFLFCAICYVVALWTEGIEVFGFRFSGSPKD